MALPYSQMEWETQERRRRKNNIAVRGIRKGGNSSGREFAQIIRAKIGIDPSIVRVRQIAGGPIITVESMRTKRIMMGRRDNLHDTGIWIEDDFTEREKEVQNWLKKEAEKLEREGNSTQVGYLKMKVNDSWWYWSDERGELKKEPFRC